LLLGCGGDDGGGAKDASSLVDGLPRDAAVDALPDALTAVQRVACPSTAVMTITTANFAFTPTPLSVARNAIVKFAPEAIHRIIPHATKPTDPGMSSGPSGEERCVQFTMAGEYNYQCAPHPSMQGVVTVTN
jgi:plastocyanin